MSDITWVSDPERDDWIFAVRSEGDTTEAWYSLKHLSSETDAVNASIQLHFPSVEEGMGFCAIVETLYQIPREFYSDSAVAAMLHAIPEWARKTTRAEQDAVLALYMSYSTTETDSKDSQETLDTDISTE